MIKNVLLVISLFSLTTVFLIPADVFAASGGGIPKGCIMTTSTATKIQNLVDRTDICSVTTTGAPPGSSPGTLICNFDFDDSCGLCCVLNTIYNITDWIFIFLVVLAAVFIILGAYFFMTSAGDTEKTKTGRNYILYAAVGLAVAFLARSVPGLVRLVTGF